MDENLIERHARITQGLAQLAQYPRYEGAFVFGSSATGLLHAGSDIDVMVLLADETEHCARINHPWVDGIGLDISFNTWADIQRMHSDTSAQSVRRQPWIYSANILFDKKGRLGQLQQHLRATARPALRPPSERDAIQFEMYTCYTKPGKCLESAPETADLIMHMELREVLRLHYSLHGRWWVADKHLPQDLLEWDAPFGQLLQNFLRAGSLAQKYAGWKELIIYVMAPLGGLDFLSMENNCPCPSCQADLTRLLAIFA